MENREKSLPIEQSGEFKSFENTERLISPAGEKGIAKITDEDLDTVVGAANVRHDVGQSPHLEKPKKLPSSSQIPL